MPSTEAELCNIALGRIGQRQYIDALTEATTEAEACAVYYGHARDVVLASFPWPWATRRAVLAVLSDDEDDADARPGWAFTYALPADCVTVLRLHDEEAGERGFTAETRIPFKLEHDPVSGLRVLLTDLENAELLYVAKLELVGLFPPLFADAVAWRLAADLALVLPVKPQVGLAMEQRYELALAKAGAAEFRQAQADVQPDSEFIRIR